MTEYILIIALIAIFIIAGIRLFRDQLNDLFKKTSDKIKSESSSSLR